MSLVKRKQYALAFSSYNLREDKQIDSEEYDDDVCSFVRASQRIQDDEEFVTELI